MNARNIFNEDWKVLTKFFPKGWRAQAKKLEVLKRKRKIKSTNILLRVLLIHLVDGCSLRETVTRAKQGKLAHLSDVALLKRLKSSSEWFRWMSLELLKRRGLEITPPNWLKDYQVKSVDASVITEPGSTGTDWRLHYCLHLYSLQCDQFIITRPEIGESFLNFKVNESDLLIGDRVYGSLKGLNYVTEKGAHYIVRLKNKAFTILEDGHEFVMIDKFKNLDVGQIGNWTVVGRTADGRELSMRLCVIKKSQKEAQRSIKKALKEAKKKQKNISKDTLELHRYIILATSLDHSISAQLILELYRFRWQIEIAFKRLKSIIGLGHLPKVDKESSRAWLHGKIFVALLAQAIVDEGRYFSPWGYPIK
jgi:hypothetical protein